MLSGSIALMQALHELLIRQIQQVHLMHDPLLGNEITHPCALIDSVRRKIQHDRNTCAQE